MQRLLANLGLFVIIQVLGGGCSHFSSVLRKKRPPLEVDYALHCLGLKKTDVKVKYPQYTIKEVSGGNSGAKLWRLSVAEAEYLVRKLPAGDNLSTVAREFTIHESMANLGIAPQVFCRNDQKKILVTQFISGGNYCVEEVSRATMEKFIQYIRRYQNVSLPVLTKKVGLQQFVSRTLNKIKRIGDTEGMPPFQKVIERIIDRFKRIHPGPEQFVVIHGDLHPGNVMMQDRIYFIDWHSSTLMNPYYDLATLSVFYSHYLSEKDILQIYFGRRPTHQEVAEFSLMVDIVKIKVGLRAWKISKGLRRKKLPVTFSLDASVLKSCSKVTQVLQSQELTRKFVRRLISSLE